MGGSNPDLSSDPQECNAQSPDSLGNNLDDSPALHKVLPFPATEEIGTFGEQIQAQMLSGLRKDINTIQNRIKDLTATIQEAENDIEYFVELSHADALKWKKEARRTALSAAAIARTTVQKTQDILACKKIELQNLLKTLEQCK